jgi:hypothetical protein
VLTKIKVAAALAATAFGLLALAAPAQAAETAPAGSTSAGSTSAAAKPPAGRPVVTLSAEDAAAKFKVVKKEGDQRQRPGAQIIEVCADYAPIWTVFYVPTGTPLFTQATHTSLCIDGTNVTRMRRATFVEVLQGPSMVTFGPADVAENTSIFPTQFYDSFGIQPFTYCAPDVWVCYSLNHNVQAFVIGNGVVGTDAFFS